MIDPVAVDFASLGPVAGSRFPDIALPNQRGTLLSLHEDRRNRRALVIIHRSARW